MTLAIKRAVSGHRTQLAETDQHIDGFLQGLVGHIETRFGGVDITLKLRDQFALLFSNGQIRCGNRII